MAAPMIQTNVPENPAAQMDIPFVVDPGGQLSFVQVAIVYKVVHRMQTRRSAVFGLWDKAFRRLDDKDKATLGGDRKVPFNATALVRAIQNRRTECERRRWILLKRSDGSEVRVRDVLERIVTFVNSFDSVGKSFNLFDPLHAALPWSAIKFLVEVGSEEFDTYAKVVEGVEYVSRIIAQFARVEEQILDMTGENKRQLTEKIVQVYTKILNFLATCKMYFDPNTGARFARTIFQSLKVTVKGLIDDLRKLIPDVETRFNDLRWENMDIRLEARHKEVTQALKELKNSLTSPTKSIEEQRNQLQDWLAPISTEDARKSALKLRIESTCDWVLQLPEFVEWVGRDPTKPNVSKLLWLSGPPGFGKTVMCARVIQYLEKEDDGNHQVLSFFCSSDHAARQQPLSILRSWLGQLIARWDQAAEVAIRDDGVQQRLKDSAGSPLSDDDEEDLLWPLFRRMLQRVPSCTLVIDGYDECVDIRPSTSKYHTDGVRARFLHDLMCNVDGTGTHVLLVSRNEADIKEALSLADPDYEDEDDDVVAVTTVGGGGGGSGQPLSVPRRQLEVGSYSITKEDTSTDVARFSEVVFATKLRGMQMSQRASLAGRAAQKSEGMFLWLHLLDRRLRRGATRRELEKLVSETPSEIDAAYERELERILDNRGGDDAGGENTERAIIIMKWVLHATRPLTVREMAEALAITNNGTASFEYPYADLPDSWTDGTVEEAYVRYNIHWPCGALIELRKRDRHTPLADQTVHFVHFSVKEFLRRRVAAFGGRSSSRTRSRSWPGPGRAVGGTGSVIRSSSGGRGNRGGSGTIGSSGNGRGSDGGNGGVGTVSFGEDSNENDWIAGLCLRYMCYDVFEDVQDVVAEDPTDFLRRFPFFSYSAASWPIHFSLAGNSSASAEGETEKAKGDSKRDIAWRLFTRKSWRTWAELFEMDLGGGDGNRADGDSSSVDSPSPEAELKEEDDDEDDSKAWLLDEEGEGEGAGDGDGDNSVTQGNGATEPSAANQPTIQTPQATASPSPVYYAALLGLSDITERLIVAKGHDPNERGGPLGSPMQAAVVNDRQDCVEVLLRHGVDPAAADGGKYTSGLVAAICLRADALAVRLVEASARLAVSAAATPSSLETTDARGWTALHHACVLGALAVVQALVEVGKVNVEARSRRGRTPLVNAMTADRLDVARYLLQSAGVHANADGPRHLSILQLAVLTDKADFLALALDLHGVNHGHGGGDARGPHTRGKGSKVNNTAYHRRRRHDDSDEEEEDAAGDADDADDHDIPLVNWRDSDGTTLLHLAANEGRPGPLRVLLEHGAEVDAEWTHTQQTALHFAVFRDSFACAKLLLRAGADPLHGSVGAAAGVLEPGTPLMVAVEAHRVNLVELLAEHLVRRDPRTRWTALAAAVDVGHVDLAERLLGGGGSISRRGSSNDDDVPLRPLATGNGAGDPGEIPHDLAPDIFALALKAERKELFDLLVRQFVPNAAPTPSPIVPKQPGSATGSTTPDGTVRSLAAAVAVATQSREPRHLNDPITSTGTEWQRRWHAATAAALASHQRQQQENQHFPPPPTPTTPAAGSIWRLDELLALQTTTWATPLQKSLSVSPQLPLLPDTLAVTLPSILLRVAVANRCHDAIRLLLARGADVFYIPGVRRSVQAAGHDGGCSGEAEEREGDAADCACIIASNLSSTHPTALQIAVEGGQREILALLLARVTDGRRGAELLGCLEGTATRAGLGQRDVIKLLIAHGALAAVLGEMKDEDEDEDDGEENGEDGDDREQKDDEHSDDDDGHGGSSAELDKGKQLLLQQHKEPQSQNHDFTWWQTALPGRWRGRYSYTQAANLADEQTSFEIKNVRLERPHQQQQNRHARNGGGSSTTGELILFEGGGSDQYGIFEIAGQVVNGVADAAVRFVKLYEKHGWMYEATIVDGAGNGGNGDAGGPSGTRMAMRGRWGAEFCEVKQGDFVAVLGAPEGEEVLF